MALPSLPSGADRAGSSLALLVLRLAVGATFVVHGAQKLFVYGLGGVIGSFGKMGVPLPVVSAPLVTAVELLGGLALLAGLGTRVAAVLLACDMVGAILLVHLRNGFFNPGGIEFPLALLAAAVALALAGGGAYAADAARGRRRS